mmetsp:Transcript_49013/g.140893  ORF Transcript_49013/g.140893 Transcript_49013/m.140893 type:complete len:389 (-) Transcript_49013:111-1277(-)
MERGEDDGGIAAACGECDTLRRVHLLPLGVVRPQQAGVSRLDLIAEDLRRRRAEGQAITLGDVIHGSGVDFIVVKCDPPSGKLARETDFYTDGSPVVRFEKVQFSAWGDVEVPSEQLFADYLATFLRGDSIPSGTRDANERMRRFLFYCNQVFRIRDVCFRVEATGPAGLGIITAQTELYTVWDSTPEFEKVQILPFEDTLPQSYGFDIFEDYLKPFLTSCVHKTFKSSDMFTYHGVQFKLLATEPSGTARIGRRTTIYCDGALEPVWENVFPPELLSQLSQLPLAFQQILLSAGRNTRDSEDQSLHRRDLYAAASQQIPSLTWPPQGSSAHRMCMICLCDFVAGAACRRLPCQHIYHEGCIDEWLRRCRDCPICRRESVDPDALYGP